MIFAIIIWIISLIGAPILAKKKGHSALLFFLLIFVLGWFPVISSIIGMIISWIILVAIPDKL